MEIRHEDLFTDDGEAEMECADIEEFNGGAQHKAAPNELGVCSNAVPSMFEECRVSG